MNKILKDTLIITIITVIAGVCLGFVYDITKEPIAATKEKAKQDAYRTVFATADSFAESDISDVSKAVPVLEEAGLSAARIDEAMEAKSASDELLGYVFTVTDSEGYGGDITITMGVSADGTLNGIEILSISETAGLGMKATDDSFKSQFSDKKVSQFSYTKNGATQDFEIDALSGATITTNAMTNAVNAGLAYFKSVAGGAVYE